MKLHLPVALLAALLACLSSFPSATAADLVWGGGNGNWSDTNWSTGGSADKVAFSSGDSAILDGTADTTITINADMAVDNITVNNEAGTYTLNGSNALSGDNGHIYKLNEGNLVISNTNAFINVTLDITGGKVTLGAVKALGTGATVNIQSGTELILSASQPVDASDKLFSAINVVGGTLTLNAPRVTGGSADTAGTISLSNSGRVVSNIGGYSLYALIQTNEGGGVFETGSGKHTKFFGQISGNHDLEKTGAGNLSLMNGDTLANYQGTLKVTAGILGFGDQSGKTANLNFTGGTVAVTDATVRLGGGNGQHVIGTNFVLGNGSTMRVWDADNAGNNYVYTLSGTMQIDAEADNAAAIHTQWAKHIGITGNLEGAGTLRYISGDQDNNEVGQRKLTIAGSNEEFTGTIAVGAATGDTAAKKRALVLGNANALVNGTVNLVHAGSSYLWINNDDRKATIAGLSGAGFIEGKSTGGSADDPDELVLNQKGELDTFTGTLQNTATLTKQGAGAFVFAGTNNSLITSSAGVLQLGNAAGAYTAGNIAATANGALNIGGTGTIANVTFSSLNLAAGATLQLDVNGQTNDVLTINTKLTVGGILNFSFTGDNLEEEHSYTLMNWEGSTAEGTENLAGTVTVGGKEGTLSISGSTLILVIASDMEYLEWNGTAAGNWNSTEPIWKKNGTESVFANGDAVNFGNLDGIDKSTVTLDGDISSERVRVNAESTDYTFTGEGAIVDISESAPTSLVKNGGGELTIENTGTNTYSGGTTISGGILNLNVAGGLGTGSITLNNGALVLGVGNALSAEEGENKLIFTGGTLAYGDGNFQDIGGKIDSSSGTVQINLNGQGGTWATALTALDKALTVGNASVQGDAAPAAATLELTLGGGLSKTLMAKDTATVKLNVTRGNSFAAGTLAGNGTMELFHDGLGSSGEVTMTGANADLTGTLKLTSDTAMPEDGSNGSSRNVRIVLAGGSGSGQFGTARLVISGINLWGQAAENAIANDVEVGTNGLGLDGNTNQNYTLSGKLTGSGGVTVLGNGRTITLAGNMSEFEGKLLFANIVQGESVANSVNLGLADGTSAAIAAANGSLFQDSVKIGGGATFSFNYNNAARLTQVLEGNSGLTQNGAGALTLTGDQTSTGVLTINADKILQLGDGSNKGGSWNAGTIVLNGTLNVAAGNNSVTALNITSGAGALNYGGSGVFTLGSVDYTGNITLSGGGSLDLQNKAFTNSLVIQRGALSNAGTYAGSETNRVSVSAIADSGNISLGGLDASKLGTVGTTTAGTLLTGLKAGTTWTISGEDNSLSLGTANISGADPFTGSDALIQFDENSGTIAFEEGSKLTLDLATVAGAMKTAGGQLSILLTNGSIGVDKNAIMNYLSPDSLFTAMGFGIEDVQGGSIVISGDTSQTYVVSVDGTGSAKAPITGLALNSYQAVIVDTDLYVSAPGTAAEDRMVLKNLTAPQTAGGAMGNLIVTNTAADKGSLELQNNLFNEGKGVDTSFAGSIGGLDGAAANTDLVKTGANKLTLSGTVSLAGNIIGQQGHLQLNGITTTETLSLDSTEAGSPATISIGGGTTAEMLGSGTNGGKLLIGTSGTLTLTGATASLSKAAISGGGTLHLADGASLELGADSTLAGVLLDLEGSLSLNRNSDALGLNGSGALELNGNKLALNSSSGTASSYEGRLGEGTLEIGGAGTQTLRSSGADTKLQINGGKLALQGQSGVDGAGLTFGTLENRGSLTLQASDNAVTALNTTLRVDGATFGSGSTTTFSLNSDGDLAQSFIQSSDSIVVENGASFHVTTLPGINITWNPGNPMELSLMELTGTGDITLGDNTLTVGGLFLTYYKNAHLVHEGNKILLKAEEQTDNPYAVLTDTANSLAGANLVWGAARSGQVDQYLTGFLSAINDDLINNPGAVSHKMAAAAGSTVTSLSMAQRDALRDQMSWLRNRTNQMGVNPAYINEDLPYFHMWMEGTGSYAQLDTKGDESGYKLTTWGGTFGVDADLSDSFTLGAAFTANYGDLTAGAADTADGHLDSYYANLFGRYQSKRWAHTLILTGGWNDAKLNRTVDYGAGSYRTEGNTNGWGMGAMYELTYDIYLNEDKSSIFQPLLNASVVRTSMDGYRETRAGSMGLNVGRQELTTGTVALGGRWMGLMGSNVFGREALAELRVNVAQDMGDERAAANVGLLGNPGYTQKVRGAKVGMTAVQLGAGLSVPVGTQGTIFVNGNADIRNGASSVNGSVGYRYDF